MKARLLAASPPLIARLRRRRDSPWSEIVRRGIPERSSEAAGRRILCATSVGSHPIARVVDSLVAMSLWLRGAEPTFLLCDGVLAACEACSYVEYRRPETFVRHGPAHLCHGCYATGADYYRPLPLPVRRYGELAAGPKATLRRAMSFSLEDCFTFEEAGLKLGEQTRAATL